MFNTFTFNSELFNPIVESPSTVRTVVKADMIPYLQRKLNDPYGNIWPKTKLQQYINQFEVEVTTRLNTIWTRFYLPVQRGVGTYALSPLVKAITRITYRSYKVDMLTQLQLSLLSPVYMTQQTRPRWASWQFDGFNVLRLYPVPGESLYPASIFNFQQFNQCVFNSATFPADVFTDLDLLNSCIISAYMYVEESNPTFSIPDYMIRPTLKNFVLWKCYAAEGQGQDTEIATYYKAKFDASIDGCIRANGRVYNNVAKQLADVAIQRPWRKHRPILPPNFGTPVDMF